MEESKIMDALVCAYLDKKDKKIGKEAIKILNPAALPPGSPSFQEILGQFMKKPDNKRRLSLEPTPLKRQKLNGTPLKRAHINGKGPASQNKKGAPVALKAKSVLAKPQQKKKESSSEEESSDEEASIVPKAKAAPVKPKQKKQESSSEEYSSYEEATLVSQNKSPKVATTKPKKKVRTMPVKAQQKKKESSSEDESRSEEEAPVNTRPAKVKKHSQKKSSSDESSDEIEQPQNKSMVFDKKILSREVRVVGSNNFKKLSRTLVKNLQNETFKEQFLEDMYNHLSGDKERPNGILFSNIIAIMEIVQLEARTKFSEEMLLNSDNVNFVKMKYNRLEALQKKESEDDEDDNSEYSEEDDVMDSEAEVELPPKYNPVTKKHYLNLIKYIFDWDDYMSPRQRIKYLRLLPKFLPHVDKPLEYVGLVFGAFDADGLRSVAALPAAYYFITRQDWTYPDVYEKVYTLMGKAALHIYCRRQFFQTVQDMLFSGYVAAYTAAAFVKKAARLTLLCSGSQPLLIAFIKNVLVKFVSIRHLIHHPNPTYCDEDPFLKNETIMNCRAMDTSLWELEPLLGHPLVSRAASFIKRELPEHITRLDTMSKNSPREMFCQALKVRTQNVSTNCVKPNGFDYPGNEMTGWDFSK